MLNVCHNCGENRADKIIDPAGPYAVCPRCGHAHPFRQLPLLIVSGASGAGKSTVCRQLVGTVKDAVLLDSDILYREEFDQPETGHRAYFEMWLRVCKNISQSGRPVVLFGAGMGVPRNIEQCVERRYFSEVAYLALVCEEAALVERLRNKSKLGLGHDQVYIDEHVRFNRWFQSSAGQTDPPIDLVDTTSLSLRETTDEVLTWIEGKLSSLYEDR